jgi:hypothetical protein
MQSGMCVKKHCLFKCLILSLIEQTMHIYWLRYIRKTSFGNISSKQIWHYTGVHTTLNFTFIFREFGKCKLWRFRTNTRRKTFTLFFYSMRYWKEKRFTATTTTKHIKTTTINKQTNKNKTKNEKYRRKKKPSTQIADNFLVILSLIEQTIHIYWLR